jgi:tetratricopeptide (TPR) repeat protein
MKRSKPHGLPPAPSWRVETDGRPFGLPLLTEIDEPLSIALWLPLRFISLWASCPPDRRSRLRPRRSGTSTASWGDAATVAPDLIPALDCFARLIQRPTSVSDHDVADACNLVHTWARENGLSNTAVHFAEAAAYADSSSPRHANTAGAACRRAGFASRASIWLNRARALSVRDPEERIRALLAMGSLMKETGRLAEAEAAFTRAATGAARRNRRRQAAEAHHDLLLLTAEQGRLDEAARHAGSAADLYPLYHDRLPYLAHDFAFALVRHGYYSHALPLLESFVRTVPEAQLLPGLSTYGWAAAGRGLLDRFRAAETGVLDLVNMEHEHASACFIHLAEGARLLKQWERAEAHAGRAAQAAAIRNDPVLMEESRSLLRDLHDRVPPVEAGEPISRQLSVLSRHLVARLRRWNPRAQGWAQARSASPRRRVAGG